MKNCPGPLSGGKRTRGRKLNFKRIAEISQELSGLMKMLQRIKQNKIGKIKARIAKKYKCSVRTVAVVRDARDAIFKRIKTEAILSQSKGDFLAAETEQTPYRAAILAGICADLSARLDRRFEKELADKHEKQTALIKSWQHDFSKKDS